ncbi:MAG: ATP-binding protein, partial [Mariprofundaceae bacterium]|nr:ATP-binding protein [Mariprofundaceae bacterium]
AHDFNNILAGIMMNIYLARQQVGEADKVLGRLQTINDACDRASGLVSQMLTFARKDKVRMEPFSLNDMLSDALRLARAGVPENIALIHKMTADSLFCMGSRVQIEQVLINLINNASDALGVAANPEIRISLEKWSAGDASAPGSGAPEGLTEGEYARLTVRDNGEGISDTERIFEPFFTTKEPGSGTGLGLAMAYGSICRHEGRIDVHSKPGEGALFEVLLPLIDEPAEDGVQDAFVNVAGGGRLLVVADDESFMRETLEDTLIKFGFNVHACENGREALKFVARNPDEVALALLDVVMPEMGGMDAAKGMRTICPELPIIFATGYDRNNVLDIEFQTMDACRVLQKPFDAIELSRALSHLLDGPGRAGKGPFDVSGRSSGAD